MKCIFNKSEKITDIEIENHARLRKLAVECMVLLKNDGTLPLNIEKVALYGNGARNTVKGSMGSGNVNCRDFANIEEALDELGVDITTKKWIEQNNKRVINSKMKYKEKIFNIVKEEGLSIDKVFLNNPYIEPDIVPILEEHISDDTDIAVYVLSRNSGEGYDRKYKEKDYLLSEEEKRSIKFVAQSYKKFILLLNIGGLIHITDLVLDPNINSIVYVGQAGQVTGYAVADLLKGESYPYGKITDTWAINYMDYPSAGSFSHNNGNVEDEYYNEGIFVGYRYFDKYNINPLFPYGYGLSYTKFNMELEDINANEKNVNIKVKVTNIGEYRGKEVVQIYYSAEDGNIIKPYQELAGFAKTKELKPNESEVVEIQFKTKNLASYHDAVHCWVIERGDFYIKMGNSSRSTKIIGKLVFKDNVTTEITRNLFKMDKDVDLFRPRNLSSITYPTEKEEKENCKTIKIFNNFECKVNSYTNSKELYQNKFDYNITFDHVIKGKNTIKELVSQLTVEELVYVCLGDYRNDKKLIGSNSKIVPGAAGDTTSNLSKSRKVPSLVIADGPSGIRIQPHFKVKDNNLLKGGEVFGLITRNFPKSTPEDAVDYYQYCTSMPIATTLAQSWDIDLIEDIGRMISKEMDAFNINIILAPGINIHRNPLCSRNFEYYSEDPLLTGKCAAALIKGVQKEKGKDAAIKHLVCNNQESNRMYTNAHITERALREIYLKGFEIAIKESNPIGIMTSYNLINGVHTANNKDLLQFCTRDEWGFDGFIMSSWFASIDIANLGIVKTDIKYVHASSIDCINDGNDIQMPGSYDNYNEILKAFNESQINLENLQFCAINVLNAVLKCVK